MLKTSSAQLTPVGETAQSHFVAIEERQRVSKSSAMGHPDALENKSEFAQVAVGCLPIPVSALSRKGTFERPGSTRSSAPGMDNGRG